MEAHLIQASRSLEIVGSLSRMGAAASTPGAPAADVGKLTLTPTQQQQLDVVSNLFQLLLSKNNIVDLASLMETEGDQCSNLIITLSAQLDKEFQRLRLKAPRGEVTEVGFLSEDQYRKIQKRETRVYMCTQIARFLLQFVILVSALTASISLMDGLPDIQPTAELHIPEDVEKYATEEINPRILSALVDARLLKEVRATGFPSQEVYSFGEYNIHYKGLIYKRSTPSKVFRISINYVRGDTCNGVSGATSLPSSFPSYGLSSGPSSKGYSSAWMTPDEEVQQKVQQELSKQAVQRAQQEVQQTAKTAQLEEEKRRALEQIQIEQMKARGFPMLDQINSEKVQINTLQTEITDLLNTDKMRALIEKTKSFVTPPISSNGSTEAKIFTIVRSKYPAQLLKIQEIENATNNYKAEINKVYGITKESMTAAFNQLQSAVQTSQTTKNALTEILTTLKSFPMEGGAGEYLQIILMPVSESSITPGYPQSSYVQSSYPPSSYPPSSYPSSQQSPQSPQGYPSQYMSGPPSYPFTGGAVLNFIMDFAGNTYDTDYFCKMRGRVSKAERSMTLAKRLEDIFANTDSKSVQIINKAGSSKSADILGDFSGFSFGKDSKSIEQLTTYFKRVLSKSATEIQSPAAYRAYLLLSGIESTSIAGRTENFIVMKSCTETDQWKNKNFSSVPAYALLGSLYANVLGLQDIDKDSNINTTDMSNLANTYGETSDKLWGRAFDYDKIYSDPTISKYCEEKIPLNSKAASVVKTAYNDLKRLYGLQLEKVVNYMKEIFVVDRTFITTLSSPALVAANYKTDETVLRLNPRFLQKDANEELLILMQRIRKDLNTHYKTVEDTYQKALNELQKVQAAGGKRIHKTRKNLRRRRTTYRKY